MITNSIAAGGNGAPVGALGSLSNGAVLASRFGLTAMPANQAGGTNYAISGALTAAVPRNGNDGNLNPNPNLPSTVQQIANYLAANSGVANPNGLYLVGTGGNDITFAQSLPTAARRSYLVGQTTQLAAGLRTLQDAGAQYIVVHGSPGSGALGVLWTQSMWNAVKAAGVNIIPSDLRAMRLAVQSTPELFGYTGATVVPGIAGPNTGSACVLQSGGGPNVGWGQWCVNTTTPSNRYAYLRSADAQQTSFYSDDEHFSVSGQKIQADYDYSLIVAPSQISYLAEAPVKTRSGVVEMIRNQLPASAQGPVGTFRGWAAGDVSSLKMTNRNTGFPDDPGTPVATTIGFDYQAMQNWLVGAAFSLSDTKQTFSLGGDYKQSEFTGSVYSAVAAGPVWANAIASAGAAKYDVNRVVPIGITTIANVGRTSGTNYSFALEGGYLFGSRSGATAALPVKAPAPTWAVSHGPVAGILLQRIRVGNFAETDPYTATTGGFTALAFETQFRNSAISELGYQASMDFGVWQPFGKLVWNHEWADLDRLVTARLTTDVNAPAYSLPAVRLGRDWGTAMLGTRYKIASNVTGYAAVIGQMGQSQVTTFGGQFGVSMTFGPAVAKF
ncbi:autotransporter outer membrane beta-barrel domain-containing protein [Rhodopseudomonas parapalustris]